MSSGGGDGDNEALLADFMSRLSLASAEDKSQMLEDVPAAVVDKMAAGIAKVDLEPLFDCLTASSAILLRRPP